MAGNHSSSDIDRRTVLSGSVGAAATLAAPGILAGQANAAVDATVETANGKLRGARENGAVYFKGIPYAADAGGANRFMAPQPVANWSGVREALRYGDRCPQIREYRTGVFHPNAPVRYSRICGQRSP